MSKLIRMKNIYYYNNLMWQTSSRRFRSRIFFVRLLLLTHVKWDYGISHWLQPYLSVEYTQSCLTSSAFKPKLKLGPGWVITPRPLWEYGYIFAPYYTDVVSTNFSFESGLLSDFKIFISVVLPIHAIPRTEDEHTTTGQTETWPLM